MLLYVLWFIQLVSKCGCASLNLEFRDENEKIRVPASTLIVTMYTLKKRLNRLNTVVEGYFIIMFVLCIYFLFRDVSMDFY